MTPKTLFSIIIKVFGLFFLKDIFATITQLLPTTFYFFRPEMAAQGAFTIAFYVIYIFIYGLMAFYLIMKSDLVIEKLKLDRDYDQESFQFNMHRSTVLSISLIIIGGLLIIEGIPTFLGQLATFYQRTTDRYRQDSPTVSFLLVSASKISIGFLLIYEKKWIVNFIERQRKK